MADEYGLPTVHLVTVEPRVAAPAGIVYSTDPKRAEGDDCNSYFIKGPEAEVVVPELAGCMLARLVGLPVPPVAVCKHGEQNYAGSLAVPNAIRDVSPWLRRRVGILNFEDLFKTIAVDVWLANKDRNMWNVVGRPDGEGISLVMIDFEKSITLRPGAIVNSAMIADGSLWPTQELGGVLRKCKGLYPPPTVIYDKIREVGEHSCGQVLDVVMQRVGDIPWRDSSVQALASRARKIRELTESVLERQ